MCADRQLLGGRLHVSVCASPQCVKIIVFRAQVIW